MTKKIFWQDPYLTTLETHVKTVQGNQITLDETIFYAFSGGQESDHGTIGGFKVLGARKAGGSENEIFYTLEPQHDLREGDVVTIAIDWERRYNLMRLHFAAEIVLELVCKRFPEMAKVGAHIAADKARIDFDCAHSLSSEIASLQEEAQHIINSNQPIESAFTDETEERRYWKINEFSQVPCGGTHLKQTGEVGQIRLKRVNPGKGKERIEIYAKLVVL